MYFIIIMQHDRERYSILELENQNVRKSYVKWIIRTIKWIPNKTPSYTIITFKRMTKFLVRVDNQLK